MTHYNKRIFENLLDPSLPVQDKKNAVKLYLSTYKEWVRETVALSAQFFNKRKYAEIISENPIPFKKPPVERKRVRVRENADGPLIASIGDIETWQSLYDRQLKLEKLRLYFCVIGWQILSKVFPDHRVFKLYEEIIGSPQFLKNKMAEHDDLDLLSLSLSSMGKIPQYNVLGLNQMEILEAEIPVKSEPFDEE